jgi:acyl-CoA thioesterase I
MCATGWRALVTIAGLVASSCSTPVTAPSRPAPRVAPGIWVALGASTTAGFIVSSPSRAWVPWLQAAVEGRGVAILNLAVAGSITPQWMTANTPPAAGRPAPLSGNNIDAAMREHPTLLLLNATNNDLVVGIGIDETVANLLAIRAIGFAGNASVVMISTQPRSLSDADLAQLRTLDGRLAAAFGDCFVDIRTPLAGPDGRLVAAYDAGDGVHPNDAGHAIIFQRVNAVLQSGRCVAAPH